MCDSKMSCSFGHEMTHFVEMCVLPTPMWCNYTDNRRYMCEGKNVTLYGGAVMRGIGCKPAKSIEIQERFEPPERLRTEYEDPSNRLQVPRDLSRGRGPSAIYIPHSKVDLWNPYEGLHMHSTAFVAMMIMGTVFDTVIFDKLVDNRRILPLKSVWETTFKNVYEISESGPIRVNRVVIPSSSEYSLHTFHQKTCSDKKIAAAYRQWVLSSFGIKTISLPYSIKHPRLLYTKRVKSGRRYMENEDELIREMSAISNLGVKTYVPHYLGMKEQLQQTHEADILLSTHGASLALLFAMQACAQVVEIVPRGQFKHYQQMAKVYGVSYHGVADKLGWGSRAYRVQIPAVIKAIEEAIVQWKRCIESTE